VPPRGNSGREIATIEFGSLAGLVDHLTAGL